MRIKRTAPNIKRLNVNSNVGYTAFYGHIFHSSNLQNKTDHFVTKFQFNTKQKFRNFFQ